MASAYCLRIFVALGVGVLLGGSELGLAVLELRATVLELLARLAELLEGVGAGAVERLHGAEAGEELVGVTAAEQVDARPEGRVHLLLGDRVAELSLLAVVVDEVVVDVAGDVVDLGLRLLGLHVELVDLLVHGLGLVERGFDVLGRDGWIGSGRRQGEQPTDQSQCLQLRRILDDVFG